MSVADGRCFADKFFHRMNAMRYERQLCDVTIVAEGQEYFTHRAVLAASCDYFQALFTSAMQEKDSSKINLEVPASVVEELLTFLYTGETRLCGSNVEELLIAADYLMIEELKLQCVDYLIGVLSSSTCLQSYSLAVKYNAKQLKRKSETFILNGFASLRKSCEFMDLDYDLLERILRSDDLVVKEEGEVYEAIVSWVDYEYEERTSFFDKLFQYGVRLCSIPEDFVMSSIAHNPLVQQSDVCMSLVVQRLQSTSVTNNAEQIVQPRKCLRTKDQAFVCLGGITSGKPLKHTLAYVPCHNQWIHLEDMAVEREEHVVVVCNDLLYVIGGMRTPKNIDRFEPHLNAWSTVAVLPDKAISSAGVCVDGKIFIIGGKDGFESVSTVQCYDPCSNVVEMSAPLTFPRSGLCAVALHGDIYAIGGCTNNDSLNTVEKMTPGGRNHWPHLAPMKHRRKYACCAVLSSGKIMMVGGYQDTCPTALNSCEVYNPECNDWQEIGSVVLPRAAAGMACVDNQVYIVGGRSDRTSTDTVEYYDEENDKWCMSTTRLPYPCAWVQCAVVSMKKYFPNTLESR